MIRAALAAVLVAQAVHPHVPGTGRNAPAAAARRAAANADLQTQLLQQQLAAPPPAAPLPSTIGAPRNAIPGYPLLITGGDAAQIDAEQFVAQARGAVAACAAARSPELVPAQHALAAAALADAQGNPNGARTAAHTAITLCAPAARSR